MGTHVPSVCEQRRGIKRVAAYDFHHHHYSGQDGCPGDVFLSQRIFFIEGMRVGEA